MVTPEHERIQPLMMMVRLHTFTDGYRVSRGKPLVYEIRPRRVSRGMLAM